MRLGGGLGSSRGRRPRRQPGRARRKERQADTVAQVAEAFMAEHVRTKRKATTAAHYQHVLNAHVLPDIGKRRAAEITLPDIARIHHRLRKSPRSPTMSSPSWVRCSHAAKYHRVPEGSNPAVGVGRTKRSIGNGISPGTSYRRSGRRSALPRLTAFLGHPTPRKRRSMRRSVLRLAAFWIDASAAAALRLLIFTGARLREILRLRWEEVDFERGLLLLPDPRRAGKLSS